MAYVLCLLYVAVIYVRPGEIVPAWAILRITQATGAAAALLALLSLGHGPELRNALSEIPATLHRG